MVYHNYVYQSYSDVKVSTIKDFWYANNVLVLLDASEFKGLVGHVWSINVYNKLIDGKNL